MCVAWPGADRYIGADLTASDVYDIVVPFPCPGTTARHRGGSLAPILSTGPGAEDGNVALQMFIIDISSP